MTYIPDKQIFTPDEFVSEPLYEMLRGSPHWIFRLFDDRLLKTAVALRRRYGPMFINDWAWGGILNQRGYRKEGVDTGAGFSDHKDGRALDSHFAEVTAVEVRADILADPWHEDFRYITCLEMTKDGAPIDWLHFATRNWDKDRYGILQLNLRTNKEE